MVMMTMRPGIHGALVYSKGFRSQEKCVGKEAESEGIRRHPLLHRYARRRNGGSGLSVLKSGYPEPATAGRGKRTRLAS